MILDAEYNTFDITFTTPFVLYSIIACQNDISQSPRYIPDSHFANQSILATFCYHQEYIVIITLI